MEVRGAGGEEGYQGQGHAGWLREEAVKGRGAHAGVGRGRGSGERWDARVANAMAVDRDEKGHTIVRRIEPTAALAKAMESGLTLSQMWTQGLIGGVPNIL